MSTVEAEQLVGKVRIKVDWTDAVQPKEAARCFNRVTLYYGRTIDTKECCDGFLKTIKSPGKEESGLEPFVVPVCGSQRLFYLSLEIFNQVKNARLVFNVPPCQVVTPKPTPAPQVVTDDWNFWLAIFIALIVIIAFLILVCCVWKFVKRKDNSEAETEVQTKPKAEQDNNVGNQVKDDGNTSAEKPKDGKINDDGRWKGKDLPQDNP